MIDQYIVDAFTDELFKGNPAAVCLVGEYPEDALMLSIAKENNLSETAFVKPLDKPGRYHLRWFTPGGEIDLCGHATLASAFVVLNQYEPNLDAVSFETLSGELVVVRRDGFYEMDFPAYDLKETSVTDAMEEAFGCRPVAAYMGRDLLCVFEREEDVRNMEPDQAKLSALDGLLQHATAAGNDVDSVSRSFAPKLAIAEDPVCGSGHCHIAPYWFDVLGKDEIVAYQASSRGGTLRCRREGDRVVLGGAAVLFSKGKLQIDAA